MSKLDGKIDLIIDKIIDGETYRKIANDLGVGLSTLHDYLNKGEHSARTRGALDYSASTYADKAESTLIEAEGTKEELIRARELAQHYRWKAGKRAPKKYGDKIDVTSDNKAIGQVDLSHLTFEQLKELANDKGNDTPTS
jgi:hypothetical protein